MPFQQDKDFRWGEVPINPRIPWNQEIQNCGNNFCNLCFVGLCSKNNHIEWGWNKYWDWDYVQWKDYRWCSYCRKNTHNTQSCKHKLVVDRQINSLKCERCSSKFKPINHYKGDRCPYEWNDDWWKS